ncbi:MAG: hypothetical protein NTU53_02560 [Planctomycetota bacterium]|nr:hypothetical protein [Planctomycetota bacterium]
MTRTSVLRGLIPLAATLPLCLVYPAIAVKINANYGSFQDTELTVLQDAVKEWADLLPCKDGMSISVEFHCDNTLPSDVIGRTSVTWRDRGFVESADITLHNSALYFTMTPPGQWDAAHQNATDALSVAKHEMGHALGFGLAPARFAQGLVSNEGIDFYNMNGNETFEAGDFRVDLELHDEGIPQPHAFSSHDVMYWSLPARTRRVPTVTDAQVLANAYGYCVPEPTGLCTISILLALASGIRIPRSRRSPA